MLTIYYIENDNENKKKTATRIFCQTCPLLIYYAAKCFASFLLSFFIYQIRLKKIKWKLITFTTCVFFPIVSYFFNENWIIASLLYSQYNTIFGLWNDLYLIMKFIVGFCLWHFKCICIYEIQYFNSKIIY